MMFTSIDPMLLTMRYEAFDDKKYLFEPKWDGWRILIHKQGDRIEAYTRQGNCVTRADYRNSKQFVMPSTLNQPSSTARVCVSETDVLCSMTSPIVGG